MEIGFAVATAVAYSVATIFHLVTVLRDQERLVRWALLTTVLGTGLHLLLIAIGSAVAGATIFLDAQGGIVVAGLVLSMIYLWLAYRYELSSLGSFVTPLSALSILAFLAPGAEVPNQGLDDALIVVHISLAFVGTIAFAFALIFSLVYVFQERQLKQKKFSPWLRRFPSLDKLDTFSVRFVGIGFAVYTISLLLGIFRAWQGQGIELDARSGLSVLTWLIYAIIIQARITAGWRGRKAAQLIIVGALSAIGVVIVYLVG